VLIDRAVLDLSALGAWLGIVPLEPPDVATAIAADATLLDLVDLLRTFHDQRTADVQADLLAVSLVVDRWDTISRYATELVNMSCRRSELGIVDLACLAVAKANKLPLVTGVAQLAGIDPDIAVIVLSRRR
jgi:PIN domain nuclease of toxin-antitoxin system